MRRIFPRGFSSPASLHIYPFPEEVIVIKHIARARLDLTPPPSLLPKTTTSHGVNQITEAERVEKKNRIFSTGISAMCRKTVGNSRFTHFTLDAFMSRSAKCRSRRREEFYSTDAQSASKFRLYVVCSNLVFIDEHI